MVIVTTTDGQKHQYNLVTRFATEEMFNNLCVYGENETLKAVFAQGEWMKLEVVDDKD